MLWDTLTVEEQESRTQAQVEFEEEMYLGGIEKYWREYERAPDEGIPEQQLLDSAVVHLTPYYQEWIDQLCSNKRTPSWVAPLLALGAGKMADITIRVIMRDWLVSGIFREGGEVGFMQPAFPLPTAQRIANSIATESLSIIAFQQSKEEFKDDWRRQSKFIKNWTPKRCNAFSKKMGKLTPKDYTIKQRQDFGHHMIRIAMSSQIIEGYTQRHKQGKTWRQKLFVGFSKHVLQSLHNQHMLSEAAMLVYRPMVVPPVPHKLGQSGGYLNHWIRKEMVQKYVSDFENGDIKEQQFSEPSQLVLDGMNGMMYTEWTVNSSVLEVMENMFKNNTRLANLPPYEFEEFMHNEAYPKDASPTVKAKWCGEREQRWGDWFKSEQARARMLVRLSLAHRMQKYDFWYMPYTLDFRGRAYSICELLSCQGCDLDKALLLFANPEKQTAEGLYWLKVHVANLFDQDKVSFDDRVKWVDDNFDMLVRISKDPYSNLEWVSDKIKKNPSFQRLAAIFDLTRTDGLTQLPVQMDGVCNGTQHWSAIMGDETNAMLTNVSPSSEPQDLYQYVADKTTDYCITNQTEIPWCKEFVEHWSDGIKRDVTKRPTMCDSYGLTFYGIQKYIRLEGHVDWVDKETRGGAVVELARAIKSSLDDSLSLPNAGKAYLKDIGTIASSVNKHIVYTVPSGFKVVHAYYKPLKRRSLAALFNHQELTFATISNHDICRKSVEQAIPPNFIHSLDASHMFCTLYRCLKEGIMDFAMVHDSYGCHATKIPLLRKLIQEEFYDMHKENLLLAFKQDVEQSLRFELPSVPERGRLDIECVLESDYFFG